MPHFASVLSLKEEIWKWNCLKRWVHHSCMLYELPDCFPELNLWCFYHACAGELTSLSSCQHWLISVSRICRIWDNKMIHCFNLCKLRRNVFIVHWFFFIKLQVCVPVPFSFPILMMFFLLIFKVSLYMCTNTLSCYMLLFYFPRLSFFFQFLIWFILFCPCYMENVKFKLVRCVHLLFLKFRNLAFCYMLQMSFPTTRLLNIYSHFLPGIWWFFFALLIHMKISVTALSSLMISADKYSVNTSCHFVSCSVYSEIVIHRIQFWHIYLRDVVGLVPANCAKVNIAIKQVTQFVLVSQCI